MIYGAGWGAGFVSGMLGLGAGLVMVPSLLSLGVNPRVASSTSAFNYFMISLNQLCTLLTEKILSE